MTLYEIIKALQSASGSNAKTAILEQNKGNELLKAYLKATYDPSLSYYQKAVPKYGKPSGRQVGFCHMDIDHAIWSFAQRNVTGEAAKRCMQKWVEDQYSVEDQELCRLLISRSVGAGVGDTMILRVWPDLYFIPSYQRCSLITPKIKKHFDSLDEIIVQKKSDGQFCYLVVPKDKEPWGCSRNGSRYPAWLVKRLLSGASERSGNVFIGELLVSIKRTGNHLNRQTGNGHYNSILKGADEEEFAGLDFFMETWDMLPVEDFEAGLCKWPYHERFEGMKNLVEWSHDNMYVTNTHFVKDLEQAYAINAGYLLEGFEGSVIKDGSSEWRNHTSQLNVKLKVVFEIDLLVTGMTEGTGKASGMMGSLTVESSCGGLKCDVGTGYSDSLRKRFWAENPVGTIITVKANDVMSNRASDVKSLFLPVYVDERLDKTVADSLERVMAQLAAAKGI